MHRDRLTCLGGFLLQDKREHFKLYTREAEYLGGDEYLLKNNDLSRALNCFSKLLLEEYACTKQRGYDIIIISYSI